MDTPTSPRSSILRCESTRPPKKTNPTSSNGAILSHLNHTCSRPPKALVESPDNGSRRREVQLTIDRADLVSISRSSERAPAIGVDERSARRALRAQVAKLEHELSAIVAEGFPHIR